MSSAASLSRDTGAALPFSQAGMRSRTAACFNYLSPRRKSPRFSPPVHYLNMLEIFFPGNGKLIDSLSEIQEALCTRFRKGTDGCCVCASFFFLSLSVSLLWFSWLHRAPQSSLCMCRACFSSVRPVCALCGIVRLSDCRPVCLSPIINDPLCETAIWETVATFTFTLTVSARLTHAEGGPNRQSDRRWMKIYSGRQIQPKHSDDICH